MDRNAPLANAMLEGLRRGAFILDAPEWPEPSFFTSGERAALRIEDARLPRSVRRALRQRGYQIEREGPLEEMLEACAAPRGDTDALWMTDRIRAAYRTLDDHQALLQWRVVHNDQLVGGCFGFRLGPVFSAESMFHRAPDAGSVAIAAMLADCHGSGVRLIDAQMDNPHLHRFGFEAHTDASYRRLLREVWTPTSVVDLALGG